MLGHLPGPTASKGVLAFLILTPEEEISFEPLHVVINLDGRVEEMTTRKTRFGSPDVQTSSSLSGDARWHQMAPPEKFEDSDLSSFQSVTNSIALNAVNCRSLRRTNSEYHRVLVPLDPGHAFQSRREHAGASILLQ